MGKSAAILLIGNELLTGKIADENLPFLSKELFSIGIRVGRVIVCPDDPEVIIQDVRALAAAHDYVFTTGGIGPTHDDVTLWAVAQAFGQKLVRHEHLEALLRGHFKEACTEAHLRMADVPEHAELVGDDQSWPTVSVEGVFVLPGVPSLVKRKFETIRAQLESDGARDGSRTSFEKRVVYTSQDEFELAELLTSVAEAHPRLSLGSYIQLGQADYKVKLTIDGEAKTDVDEALRKLVEGLGASVVRVES